MSASRALLALAASWGLIASGCGDEAAEAMGPDAVGSGDTAECLSGCEADTESPGASLDLTAPPDEVLEAEDLPPIPEDTPTAAEEVAAPEGGLAGACLDAQDPQIATTPWKHSFASPLARAAGAPNHRIRDVIAAVGSVEGAQLRGRFTYGVIDKDLEDEEVQLWIRTCPGWELVGTQITDVDGVVWFSLPALAPGDYAVRMIVSGDATVAYGHVAVWPQGMPVIVTDVDGTLTTSDWQLFQDLLGGPPAEEVDGGHEVMQRWAEKGYRILYLTGRPQVFNRYSNEWLRNNGFPEGVVHLTDDAGDVLPTESGVQAFKAAWLQSVAADHAVHVEAAYGNASTDIGAYGAAGLAKDHTFIYGPNGGDEGTTALDSYVEHLSWVDAEPDAVLPTP